MQLCSYLPLQKAQKTISKTDQAAYVTSKLNENSLLMITIRSKDAGAKKVLKLSTTTAMVSRIHSNMLITAILRLVSVTMKMTYLPKFTAWLNNACTSTVFGEGTNTLIHATPLLILGLKQFKVLDAH